jgi:two-component system, NtrC family, response regulator HydG
MLQVLVVDDDDVVRESIAEAVCGAGHTVVQASDGEAALTLLGTHSFDLAICDVHMPRLDGLTLFRLLHRDSPGTAVVLMTSFGHIPDAVGSLRGGAVDYVTKPFDPEEFAAKVVTPIAERRALSRRFEQTRAMFVATEAGGSLVGTSLVMRQLTERIAAIGKSDASVFISGGRGTGKSLVARCLHAQSPRRDGPFVVVPCASLPGLMIASGLRELSQPLLPKHRDEWFRAAEGGTLVLDGVDELPGTAQSNLARVIDEPLARARRDHAWQPRGVRIISIATARPASLVAHAGFLQGLIFRLNTLEMRVPSLAEREGDLYTLVCHFIRESTPSGRRSSGLTPRAWKAISSYKFPENVRELAWLIEHAVAAAEGGEVDLRHLPGRVTDGAARDDGDGDGSA